MIYVTGDTHGDWFRRLHPITFPDGQDLTKDDFVIVCGDFGIWNDSEEERYYLSWLNERPFTTLFVDGNHENFNQLYNYPVVDFHGGKAHKINDSVYHLMRGEVFCLEGCRCFAFGGAPSHDIYDGILQPEEEDKIMEYRKMGKMFRVENVSWWPQEIPNEEEMRHGWNNLEKNNWTVDFVFTHDAPASIAAQVLMGEARVNPVTGYLEKIHERLDYRNWYFGHYHDDWSISAKDHLLFRQVVRIH